jgi:hypothetical protein
MTAGALGLIAAAVLGLLGSLTGGAWSGVATSAGAWLTVAATAAVYRPVARACGPRLPASALGLLGVVAAAGTIATTLRLAYPNNALDGVRVAAILGSGIGLALLAWAFGRARLAPAPLSPVLVSAPLLGCLAGDPGLPYLVGSGPLGVVLLIAAIRTRISRRRTATTGQTFRRVDPRRGDRIAAVALGASR